MMKRPASSFVADATPGAKQPRVAVTTPDPDVAPRRRLKVETSDASIASSDHVVATRKVKHAATIYVVCKGCGLEVSSGSVATRTTFGCSACGCKKFTEHTDAPMHMRCH